MTQTEQAAYREYVRAEIRSPKQHVRDYYNHLEAVQIEAWRKRHSERTDG